MAATLLMTLSCGAQAQMVGAPRAVTVPKADAIPPSIALPGPVVEATVTINGKGSVDIGAIKCAVLTSQTSKICTPQVARDKPVQLKAMPAAGMEFVAWAGACSGSTPTCQVTPTKALTVSATFAPAAPTGTRKLTIKSQQSVISGATINLSPDFTVNCSPASVPQGAQNWIRTCTANVPAGTTLTLKGEWDVGLSFVTSKPLKPGNWNGACDSAQNDTCVIKLDEDKTVIVSQP
ncbi:MAG: hypothetical protein V4459_13350 [Pseudomonadota bacterium]